ncbi:FAD dependent oxidoreductase [Suillus plorans]|uniref:FAD dependent oxidoreductase n=1 Tax=Suillus plorans TaxID=116603 RepID=A0A9P7ASI2_9AGAM|nr:FAD dependent oxidoreductase [Suillus plorans]KAG1794184.1 FAD dependent oxidoreductase [Suillus plorans]
MGNTLSLVRLALTEFLDNLHTFQTLQARIQRSPGLPLPNPSRSFWCYPPSPIATHVSQLPTHADFIVVGSGITGTSVVRRLLYSASAEGHNVRVVMLEARDVCSGATGRNGGHISPPLHHDYTSLKRDHGQAVAQKIIKLRLAHLEELRSVAEQEGILTESQWREVESVDVFYNSDMFEKAKRKVQTYKADLAFDAEHHEVYEAKEAIEKYRLASDTLGCISSSAGAIHPYQFVTGILAKLLARYPDRFSLCTNTPCTSISPPTSSNPYYTLSTPRGTITTPHIVHATNGWASTLLEKLRGKIIPFRGNMSAQRPGQSLPIPGSNPTSHRSFVFYTRPIGYDYLTQLPTGEHELMLGGGFAQDGDEGYEAMANTDDTTYSTRTTTHLSGVLPRYFGEDNWGREGVPLERGEGMWAEGRVKALWSGILGISVDLIPWVGRLPRVVSGRSEPPLSSVVKSEKEEGVHVSAAPGEWIAAGYSGEGMVHAWLSGKALADMVLGREAEGRLGEWFPDIMRVTEKRWKKAKVENLLDTWDD